MKAPTLKIPGKKTRRSGLNSGVIPKVKEPEDDWKWKIDKTPGTNFGDYSLDLMKLE